MIWLQLNKIRIKKAQVGRWWEAEFAEAMATSGFAIGVQRDLQMFNHGGDLTL